LSFYIDSSRRIFYKYYNAAETRRGHLSFASLIFLTASVACACMFCARSNGYPGKSYLAELRHWCSVDCDVVHCDGSAAVAVVSVPSKCCQRGRQRSGEHAKWSHHSAWTAYVSRFGWCLLLIHIAPLYSFSAPYSWCLLTMIVFFQTSFTTCLNSLLLDHCFVTVSLKVSSLSLTTFCQKLKSRLFKQLYYVFSALTLLVGCQEEHPACKHWMMSVWSKVQIVCMWSSWCQCIPKPRHLLPHLNPDWFFWYRLTQVVPENRPLNRFGVVVLVVKQSCLDIIRQ